MVVELVLGRLGLCFEGRTRELIRGVGLLPGVENIFVHEVQLQVLHVEVVGAVDGIGFANFYIGQRVAIWVPVLKFVVRSEVRKGGLV